VPERALLLIEPAKRHSRVNIPASEVRRIKYLKRSEINCILANMTGREGGNEVVNGVVHGAVDRELTERKRFGFVRAENWHQHQINSLPPICL
jgi:hypothetical protein